MPQPDLVKKQGPCIVSTAVQKLTKDLEQNKAGPVNLTGGPDLTGTGHGFDQYLHREKSSGLAPHLSEPALSGAERVDFGTTDLSKTRQRH